MSAGRAGEAASTGLTERLMELGFETDRLKTGTPARVDRRTVNFAGGVGRGGRVGMWVVAHLGQRSKTGREEWSAVLHSTRSMAMPHHLHLPAELLTFCGEVAFLQAVPCSSEHPVVSP